MPLYSNALLLTNPTPKICNGFIIQKTYCQELASRINNILTTTDVKTNFDSILG